MVWKYCSPSCFAALGIVFSSCVELVQLKHLFRAVVASFEHLKSWSGQF